jgi:type II secretory pathway component PulC
MKVLLLAFGLSASPTLAFASSASSTEAGDQDARLVPVVRDDVLVGLKVLAIRPDGQFAKAGFHNGDIIERVDNHPITSEMGARRLDTFIAGTATTKIDVRRRNELVTLICRVLISRK